MPDTIWAFRSPNDGYFAGVVIAGSKEQAQRMAFDLHFMMDAEPVKIDGLTIKPSRLPGERRAEYGHNDPSGADYEVTNLGTSYVGADGEGNLEVEF